MLLSAGLAGCSPDQGAAAATPQRAKPLPNIVVYLVDTLRADALGVDGAAADVSPGIDAFASEAAVFDNALSQAPWTLPSTTSFQTSSYPVSSRILHDGDKVGAQAETLVEYMQSLGYHTVGFISNPVGGSLAGLDQGFDEFTEHWLPKKPAPGEPAPQGDPLQPLFDWAAGEHGDEPQFLYVHTLEPHDPYDGAMHEPAGRFVGTPEEREHLRVWMNVQRGLGVRQFNGKLSPDEATRLQYATTHLVGREHDIRDLYDGDVRQASDNFERLIGLLRSKPGWKDTVVVFLSDHGEEFHEHGSWFHGHSAYQELLHVPLILRVPGLTDAGMHVSEPVQLIDVLPTLAELVGGPVSPDWQGRSLVPLLRGVRDAPPRPVFAMRVVTEQSLRGERGLTETALIDGTWKLIVHHDVGRASLFDLAHDPAEQHDLSAEQPERAQAMLRAVEERLQQLPVLPLRSTETPDAAAQAMRREQLENLGYVERARPR